MDLKEKALKAHKEKKGKIEVKSKFSLKTREDLSIGYTPGVAEPCKEIAKNKDLVYEYTAKGNLVAVVSDGTAVLGLGDIGPEAGMPVMEGKAILFKEFANVDAFPVCVATKDVDEIVQTVKNISPCFGGINLEDISAPRCMEVENRLKKELDIPIFHDDQHGTAIVVLAGLLNALKVVGKNVEDVKVVVSGAGAAGIAVTRLLRCLGINKKICISVKDIIVCDKAGAIYEGRTERMNPYKEEIARETNKEKLKGSLADAMKGADVFIGVSAPGLVNEEMVKSMAEKPIVFAMSNPVPEIMPDEAKEADAEIYASGRSDFPNQINNVLAFPGVFRGALDVRASAINEEMKIAAAHAIASMIENPTEENIIPSALDKNVAKKVAEAVAKTARETGVAKL